MRHIVTAPPGYKLVPTQMTEDQLVAIDGLHYTPSDERRARINYAAAVEAAPVIDVHVDVELNDGTPVTQLILELANWIEALPVIQGVTDGACAMLHKVELALGMSGPDTHCARRIRRILNAQEV